MLGASTLPQAPPETGRQFNSRDFASTGLPFKRKSSRRVRLDAIHSFALDRAALLERPQAMCYLDKAT
jgi:hypothetical protein